MLGRSPKYSAGSAGSLRGKCESRIAPLRLGVASAHRQRTPWVRTDTRHYEWTLIGSNRLLFLAEFLEHGIAAQRIPERIEPKERWRNRYRVVKVAIIGRL